jgi:hypothetical protein
LIRLPRHLICSPVPFVNWNSPLTLKIFLWGALYLDWRNICWFTLHGVWHEEQYYAVRNTAYFKTIMMFMSMVWDYVSELRPPTGLLFIPPSDIMSTVEWYQHGKIEKLEIKTCLSAILFITNPIRNNPGANPGLRCKRRATNRLSHGTT